MTITWSPALAPAYRVDDDEPPYCGSHYYPAPGGIRTGPMACGDYVGHPQSGGPGSPHSGGSPEFPFRWTDAMALQSLVEFGPYARKTGPLCTDCNDLPQSTRGLCASCAAGELTRDDYEAPESEAA